MDVRALAVKAGMNYTSVSLILRGRRSPRMSSAAKLARAMGVPIDRLMRLIEQSVIEQEAEQAAD